MTAKRPTRSEVMAAFDEELKRRGWREAVDRVAALFGGFAEETFVVPEMDPEVSMRCGYLVSKACESAMLSGEWKSAVCTVAARSNAWERIKGLLVDVLGGDEIVLSARIKEVIQRMTAPEMGVGPNADLK